MSELSATFANFHLLRPWWLLLLLPSLLLLWQLLRERTGNSAWADVVEPDLLAALQNQHKGGHSQPNRLPLLLLFSFWLLALIALTGPTWERQPTPGWESEAALVLLLDLSPSMAENDLPPSRLERARFKLMDILQQRKEGRTALILFSAEPYLVTPQTDDVNTIRNLLAAVERDILPTEGDSAAPAITMATQLLQQGGAEQGELLLLSDGVADIADTLNAVHQLRQQGYRLSLLGLHPNETTPLESIAATGGGRYAPLSADERDLHHLLASTRPELESAQRQQGLVEHWVEAGVWLLLPIALLAAVAFRRGWALVLLITTLPHMPPAEAVEWADLWLRSDQQAARTLSAGDAASAAQQFQHPGWRGTALYQQGEYDAAAEAFAHSSDPDAHYNRGNALAKGGKLEQAVTAYQEMLAQQPDHHDAQRNLELVQQLLEQQQQQTDTASQNSNSEQQQGESEQQPPESAQPSNKAGDENSERGEERQPNVPSEEDNSDEPESTPSATEEKRDNEGVASADREDESASPTSDKPSSDPASDRLPRSEAEMESEQWLKQIPEDPSGLLRRKFMLEHLYRKQRNNL